ncbi:carbohydrate ABC transporter permease [uncultured Robinsoniella sp.]|uniref:carbohydrate ABC transporter permease n=1 Tax=uncultured Robinsoniella sp. TaxID=904190 RepID=UPI00374EAC07
MKNRKYRNPLMPSGIKLAAYLSIPVGVYIFIIIIPTLFAFGYSFFEWSGGPSKKFIGFENYIALFKDDTFWLSFKNTILFTFLMVIGQVGIAFVFTLFFTMKWVKFVELHRRVMYFPSIIAAVVIGLMWQLIYNNDFGILNYILRAAGLEQWIKPWLDDPKIAMFSVAVPVIWQFVGYYLVLLMGAVATIPKDIMEVAEIDGATGFKKSIYITIPLIWDTLKICLMICFAGSFKAFDHIMVMTGGGPGRATSVLSLYNYNTSFVQMKMGYASAMAVVILVVSMGLTIGIQRLMEGKSYDH